MRTLIAIILNFIFLTSCGNKEKDVQEDLLLRYGDEELTEQEIIDKIPKGIHPADSTAMFRSLVDSWIKDHVLVDFASQRLPDLEAIERKVRDFRNTLIVQEYLTRMRESQPLKIDELKVKEYYDRHRHELKLEVPLVKGIFLKINSAASGKEEIKSLLSSKDVSSIDKLEQEWLDRALEYNYFRDKWIDWETLTSLIPFRFGDPEIFLKENNYFETEYDDCSYFLQISDYLPAGSEQPYEFASTWIGGLLNRSNLSDYEQSLTHSLVTKSIKENKLELLGYDPLTHEKIDKPVNKENEK